MDLSDLHELTRKTQTSKDLLTNYIMTKFIKPKMIPAQEKLIEETMKHRRSMMLGSQDELHLLAMLCKLIQAKKTLDIGVFTGYSALTIALALPQGGTVVACDINDDYASIGKPFWEEAGVSEKIDLRIAPAMETLNSLAKTESGTFDFAFIDADKENYANYYEICLQLLRPGGMIAVDNTIWSGKILSDQFQDKDTMAIKALNDFVPTDNRVESTLLNMADGVLLAIKK